MEVLVEGIQRKEVLVEGNKRRFDVIVGLFQCTLQKQINQVHDFRWVEFLEPAFRKGLRQGNA